MAINNELNTATVPIPVPSGGTGASSAIAYGVMCGGTTTTSALQSISPGTAGYVCRSNGAGALPSFQPPDLILVGSASVTNVATIDFTGLSVDYFGYKFVIQYMLPATDGVIPVIRLSTDNGSSFISSAGAYSYRVSILAAALTDYSSTSDTGMGFALNTGNTSLSGGLYGEITLINPAYSPVYTTYIGKIFQRNSTATNENCVVYGIRNNAEANNAIRFQFNSGNIADAMIRVYGMKDF